MDADKRADRTLIRKELVWGISGAIAGARQYSHHVTGLRIQPCRQDRNRFGTRNEGEWKLSQIPSSGSGEKTANEPTNRSADCNWRAARSY